MTLEYTKAQMMKSVKMEPESSKVCPRLLIPIYSSANKCPKIHMTLQYPNYFQILISKSQKHACNNEKNIDTSQ